MRLALQDESQRAGSEESLMGKEGVACRSEYRGSYQLVVYVYFYYHSITPSIHVYAFNYTFTTHWGRPGNPP